MDVDNPILEQIARFKEFFKNMERTPSEEDDIFGEHWQVGKLDILMKWNIGLVPMTDCLHFRHTSLTPRTSSPS